MKKNIGLLVAGGILSLGAFAADESITLGGYADVGYEAYMQKNIAGVSIPDASGFLVREGALYVGKKWGEWEVFGDLAFGQVGRYNSLTNNVTINNGLNVGVSQAYVSQKMENGVRWQLGKFDGLFGYYAGRFDSHAHRLSTTGYIQGAYLPRTQTGINAGYSFSDMLKVSLVVANDEEFGPSSSGVVDATGLKTPTTTGTRHPDFGFNVAADFDTFNANVGALLMTGEATPAAGNKSKLGVMVDAVLEAKLRPINLGVYGVYFKDDEELSKSDFGVGAVAGYDVNDKLGADLRVEYVTMSGSKNELYSPVTQQWQTYGDGTSVQIKHILNATLGGQWKFNDNIKAKLDYTLQTVGTTGGKFDPGHIVNAGVVANF